MVGLDMSTRTSSSLVVSAMAARTGPVRAYVSRSRSLDASHSQSLTLTHSIKINEDNNKDTTAKGLSCQSSLILPLLPMLI